MNAKSLRKQFNTVMAFNTNLFKNGIFDNICIRGFRAMKQEAGKVETFRVVLLNKRFVYLVPEREFRHSF